MRETFSSINNVPAPNMSRALIPRVINGEACDMEQPIVLAAGIDTLYFSFDIEVSEAIWARLEEERVVAQFLMQERRAVHCPEWLNAQISPSGAKGGYRFLLETPFFSIKLLRGVPHRPPIFVEMRAFGLHTHKGGEEAACEAACSYIRDVLLADQDPEWAALAITLDTARCSRLDPYIDWQRGWHPTFEGGDERCFVKCSHANVDRYSCDGAVTGYSIGKGELRARIYNKTQQMTQTRIEWYRELLTARNGDRYDSEVPVWRLEFQLLREGV